MYWSYFMDFKFPTLPSSSRFITKDLNWYEPARSCEEEVDANRDYELYSWILDLEHIREHINKHNNEHNTICRCFMQYIVFMITNNLRHCYFIFIFHAKHKFHTVHPERWFGSWIVTQIWRHVYTSSKLRAWHRITIN